MATSQTKKTKIELGEEIDRISSLPDPIIHHILSFLPSTLTAIKTCVLSKRWRYLWTHVPVLIFDYHTPKTHFSTFVGSALIIHDSPTITKFVLHTGDYNQSYSLTSLLPVWIRFAMRKQVKELTLDLGYSDFDKLPIPQFFFNNDSLVKFEGLGLDFKSCGLVNWPSLKVFSVRSCGGIDKAIWNILYGSPLLESLEFICSAWNVPVVIASTSLKRLVVVNEIGERAAFEIACPNLEELILSYTFWLESFKLVDLPPSARVTLDLREHHSVYVLDDLEEVDINKEHQILQSVKHVDVLTIGKSLLQVFSVLVVVRSLSPPLMSAKSLTLNVLDFDRGLPGIVCLLRNSPVLEKLIIDFERFEVSLHKTILESHDYGEKYLNSQENVLSSSVSHLKTIEIYGLIEQSWEVQHKLVLRFLKCLVKNSKSLNEVAIFRKGMTEFNGCHCRVGQELALEHFDYLLSIQRCNLRVLVTLPCCKRHAIASQEGESQM